MKKILILLGSQRKKGNTAALAEAFAKGAREAGAAVTSFALQNACIYDCRNCGYCEQHAGNCIQQDDMQVLYPLLQSHDTIVFATPVYYLGFPGKVKNVIDRTYAESVQGRKIKHAVLLTSACKKEPAITEVLVSYYQKLMKYLAIQNLGMVNAYGMEQVQQVRDTNYMKEAYELGKTM